MEFTGIYHAFTPPAVLPVKRNWLLAHVNRKTVTHDVMLWQVSRFKALPFENYPVPAQRHTTKQDRTRRCRGEYLRITYANQLNCAGCCAPVVYVRVPFADCH